MSIWSRDGAPLAIFAADDARGGHAMWRRGPVKTSYGLVWHVSEAAPSFPGSGAFMYQSFLITQRAAEVRAGLPPGSYSRRATGPVPVVMPLDGRPVAVAGPRVPLIEPDLVALVAEVDVAALSKNRIVQTTLIRLGVRRGADLAGIGEAEALARLGGDADLLASFRKRIEVSGRALAKAADATGGVGAPAARTVARKGRAGGADGLRRAEFRLTPLLERVRRSLGNLTHREASIVSRRIGLNGYPATPAALAEELGLEPDKVQRMIDRSLAKIEATDGWPGLLGGLASEILPLSGFDMAASPWFEGLGPKRLAGLMRIGSGMDASVASTSLGTVVGSASQEGWDAMRRMAREVVAATITDASPGEFLKNVRAGIPAGMESYERLLLREIGWPGAPRKDWLLAMKGRLTPHALERRTLVRSKGPLGAVAVAATIGRSNADDVGEPVKVPDAQAWEPDAATLAKVRGALERCLRGYGPDFVPATFAEFLPTIKGDPALAGLHVDVALARSATLGSPTLTVTVAGNIVVGGPHAARDADATEEVAFRP